MAPNDRIFCFQCSPRAGQQLPRIVIQTVDGLAHILIEGADDFWSVPEGQTVEIAVDPLRPDVAGLRITRVVDLRPPEDSK